MRELLALAGGEEIPTIVAGDFNLSDTSQAYSWLGDVLHDSHRAAGWGLGLTFPASPEFVSKIVLAAIGNALRTRPGNIEPLFRIAGFLLFLF